MKDRLLYACMVNRFRCVRLFVTLRMVACQDPLSMGFSRQEYCRGLPFPSPRDLPDPGTEPASPVSPWLAGNSLLLNHLGSQLIQNIFKSNWLHARYILRSEVKRELAISEWFNKIRILGFHKVSERNEAQEAEGQITKESWCHTKDF